jgi:hypothetical protein
MALIETGSSDPPAPPGRVDGLLAGKPELLVAFLVIARQLGAPTQGDNMQGLDFFVVFLAATRLVAVLLRHDDVMRVSWFRPMVSVWTITSLSLRTCGQFAHEVGAAERVHHHHSFTALISRPKCASR